MKSFVKTYTGVFTQGKEHDSRFGKVRSIDNASVWADAGYVPRRERDNIAIGIMEGLQFLAGTNSVPAIAAVAHKARLDLFGKSSFYGPRGSWQLDNVVRAIEEDPNTRRAVVTLAEPGESPDTLPCTLAIQFTYNSTTSGLSVSAYMRSSDMVWGLPYDLIQFYIVGEAVARCLGLNAEYVNVHAGNMHVYDNTAVSPSAWAPGYVLLPDVQATSINEWKHWAKSIVESQPDAKTLIEMFKVPT